MREGYTLEDINSAFDSGAVDCKEILNSDDPLDALYDQLDQYDGGPQSAVADEYLPNTDELLG